WKRRQTIDVFLKRGHCRWPNPRAYKLHCHLHHECAGFRQIVQRYAAEMEHVADRSGDDIGIALQDESAAVRALVQADDAGDLEAAQGFTYRSPANPEL